MRKSSLCSASLAAFFLSLSGCDNSGSATGTAASSSRDTTVIYSYRMITDTLILMPGTGKTYVYSSCSMDYSVTPSVPKLARDTFVATGDDSLSVHASAKVLLLGGYTDYIGSTSTKYLVRMIYERVGTGTGLVGTWNATFRDSILPLNVPANDTAIQRLRAESAKWSTRYLETGISSQIVISANGLITVHAKQGSPAKIEVYYWDRENAANYSVTAKATSDNTLTYTGTKTGEVVTLTLATNGDKTYSSTNTKRTPYTINEEPTSVSQCPSDPWFTTFLSENYKSSSVAGGRVQEIGSTPKQVFTRLPRGF